MRLLKLSKRLIFDCESNLNYRYPMVESSPLKRSFEKYGFYLSVSSAFRGQPFPWLIPASRCGAA